MQTVFEVLAVLHLVALVGVLVGWGIQIPKPTKRINPAMLHGSLTQLVTGVAMVGLADSVLADEEDINHVKIGIKLVVLLVIVFLNWTNRAKESVPTAVWATIGGLTLVNVLVAVLV